MDDNEVLLVANYNDKNKCHCGNLPTVVRSFANGRKEDSGMCGCCFFGSFEMLDASEWQSNKVTK